MSRFRLHTLPIADTRAFSQLVVDYAHNAPGLRSFYGLRPDVEAFRLQMKARADFDSEHRCVLVNALTQQYGRLKNVQVAPDRVEKNIAALKDPDTFTVTTGHQLNLFTGPLYFWYKIIHVINLAGELKKACPEYHFVPVYWMATEDHDFAEIDHIHLFGKTLRWHRSDGGAGAVGRLSMAGFETVLNELNELTGPSANARDLHDLFRRAYLGQNTLADATRYLVHEFFTGDGLVILDGDDLSLKELFHPAAGREIKEKLTHKHAAEAAAQLKQKYHVQVDPREINLFYLDELGRDRIGASEAGWHVVNREKTFDTAAIEMEMTRHPERFSPNVLMRPLYQETILPNLAYIGGGAELAYWMELKNGFEAFAVPFPLLFLRNSALIVSAREHDKWERLGLEWADLFGETEALVEQCVTGQSNENLDFQKYRRILEELFAEMEQIADRTEKSFGGAVRAQRQKQLNGLEKLHRRLLRAEKRKHQQLADRVRTLKKPFSRWGSFRNASIILFRITSNTARISNAD